jgi:hypothetical protein
MKLKVKNDGPVAEAEFTLVLEGGGTEARVVIQDEKGNRAGLVMFSVADGMLQIDRLWHYGNFKGFPVRHITFFPNRACLNSSASVIYEPEVNR